jgi:hypothetical protein
LAISLVTFGCIFGGTMLGILFHEMLPDHHLSAESKDSVKLGTGMIGMLAALVLGLLIASAKGNFDTMSSGLKQAGAKIISLDRVMADYGPETKDARDLLRRAVAAVIERVWPDERTGRKEVKVFDAGVGIETIQGHLSRLTPKNDSQRWLQSRALQLIGEIGDARWLLVEQSHESSLPMLLLFILIFWLTVIFSSFGLFSPRNATVVVVLLVCALSAAGSLFMILELDRPLEGVIRLSDAPLRNALVLLGR